mgnify:CR=1 FL=1
MSKNLIELPNPKSSTQEVLITLIKQKHVSIFDFKYLSGFRTRVSDLRLKYGLNLTTVMSERCNKFGNKYRYAIHKLPESEVEKAVGIYEKITEQR